MMKTILITKDNVENFAKEMFKFNCNNTYNSLCFSCSDIRREQHALNCTDAIIKEMDKAGFDIISPTKTTLSYITHATCMKTILIDKISMIIIQTTHQTMSLISTEFCKYKRQYCSAILAIY